MSTEQPGLPAAAAPLAARAGAAAVDVLAVGTGVLVVSALLGAVLPPAIGASPALTWGLVAVAVLVVAPLWEVVTRSSGGTLGQRFAGIEVRAVDGTVPSAGQIWWRCLVRMAGAVPFGAGFALAVSDPRRRTLADRAASTVVVRRAARVVAVPPLPLPAWDASRLAGPPRWEQFRYPVAIAAGGPTPPQVPAGPVASTQPPPTGPGGSRPWGGGGGEGQDAGEGGAGWAPGGGGAVGGPSGPGGVGGPTGPGVGSGPTGPGVGGGLGGGDFGGGRPADPQGGPGAAEPGGSDLAGGGPAAASTPPAGETAAPSQTKALDPNMVAIDEARLGGESAAWLKAVAGQVELRLDRINREWRNVPGSEAAPAVAFGLLLGHLARIYPHMRSDLERTAESHPSYSTLGSGGRLPTLEQLAGDRGRLATWLGPLVGTGDVDRVSSVLD